MLLADPFVDSFREWVKVFMCISMRGFIRYARDSGLSMSQLGALFFIYRDGGNGVTDLGEALGVSSAAASQMLERLVQQDLILRFEDPVDRRVKQLVLTEKGTQTIHDSIQARLGWLEGLGNTLSVSEKEQVTATLHLLNEKMQLLENPAFMGN